MHFRKWRIRWFPLRTLGTLWNMWFPKLDLGYFWRGERCHRGPVAMPLKAKSPLAAIEGWRRWLMTWLTNAGHDSRHQPVNCAGLGVSIHPSQNLIPPRQSLTSRAPTRISDRRHRGWRSLSPFSTSNFRNPTPFSKACVSTNPGEWAGPDLLREALLQKKR